MDKKKIMSYKGNFKKFYLACFVHYQSKKVPKDFKYSEVIKFINKTIIVIEYES